MTKDEIEDHIKRAFGTLAEELTYHEPYFIVTNKSLAPSGSSGSVAVNTKWDVDDSTMNLRILNAMNCLVNGLTGIDRG